MVASVLARLLAFPARALIFAALLAYSLTPLHAEGWVSPTSSADPDSAWADAMNAADGNSSTYARNFAGSSGWGGYIEYAFGSTIHTSQVRVTSDFGYGVVDSVDVDMKVSGTWSNVFEGSVDDASATILTFAAVDATHVRFRYHYTTSGWEFWLYEIDAYASTPPTTPTVASLPATSVWGTSGVPHAEITSAGGAPCEVRFEYGTTTSYGSTTAWSGALGTNETIGAVISGLSNSTVYHYRAQARNSSGTIAYGADRSFSTSSTVGHRWISPNAVSGSDWTGGTSALDDETTSSARYQHVVGADQWSPYLTLTNPSVLAEGMRVTAAKSTNVDEIEVSANIDGSWSVLYDGAFTDGALQTYTFTPGTVTQTRVRLHVSATTYGLYWNVAQVQILANDSSGTTAVWDGGGSDNLWSTPENWTTDLVPNSTDAVVFNDTSSKNATISSAVSVASITVDSGYTGAITQGASVTTSGNIALSGGSWSASSQTITCAGNFAIANTTSVFSRGTSTVSLTGTGTLSNPNVSNAFYDLTVGASGQTTTLTGDAYVRHLCTVTAGTVRTYSSSTGYSLRLRGSGTLLSLGGSFDGDFGSGGGQIVYEADTTTAVNVNGANYGGARLVLSTIGAITGTFSQQGAITGTDSIATVGDSSSSVMAWNTNNYNVTTNSWMSTENFGTASGSTTLACGSSTFTVPSLCWFSGADSINLGSSSFAVGGWGFWNSSASVTVGTSTVTLSGGDIGASWMGGPESFYNLVIDSTGSHNFGQDVSIGHDLTVTTGTLATGSANVTVGRDVSVSSTGILSAGTSAITIGRDLTISNSSGRLVAGMSSITMTGSSTVTNPDASNSFYNLTVGPTSATTTLGSDITVTHRCTVGNGTLDFHSGGLGRTLHLRGSGQLLSFSGTLSGIWPSGANGGVVSYEATSNTALRVEGGSYGHCRLALSSIGGAEATFDQNGDITLIDSFVTDIDTHDAVLTYNTNNHNIEDDSWMSVGNWGGAHGGTIFNAGSSTIVVPSLCWFTTGADILNLGSSTWVVGTWGRWQDGTTNVGTSTVQVAGDVGISWAAVPQRFNNLQIGASATSTALGAIFASGNLSITSGTFASNGHAVSFGGDLSVSSGAAVNFNAAWTYIAGTGNQNIAFGTSPALAGIHVSSGTRTVTFLHGFSASDFESESGVTLVMPASETISTGNILLLGTSTAPITVSSSVSGTASRLNVTGGQELTYVAAKDSDASGGATIDDTSNGVNNGGNTNWLFPGSGITATIPATSVVSPLYVEGRKANLEDVTATDDGSALTVSTYRSDRFYINAPLNAAHSVPLSLVSTNTVSQSVTWAPTVVSGTSSVTIRVNDALLFQMSEAGAFRIEQSCGYLVSEYSVTAGEQRAQTFDVAGLYTAIAKNGSGVEVGRVNVTVVGVNFSGPIACELAYKREKSVSISGGTASNVTFESNALELLETSVKEPVTGGVTLYLKALRRGDPAVMARLIGPNSPIIAIQAVDWFTLVSDLANGFVYHVESGGDGYGHAMLGFTMTPKLSYVTINVDIFIPTASVGGLTNFDVPGTALDANGHWEAEMLISPGSELVCHRFTVFQP